MKKQTDWIETFTGKRFYPLEPESRDVDILDIAHPLANICRFNGHSTRFYSVAEHSILMCEFARKMGHCGENLITFLLHDAHEAYVGDLTRPFKQSLRQTSEFLYDVYTKMFTRLDKAIFEGLGFDYTYLELNKNLIKCLDNAILAKEKEILFPDSPNKWSLSEKPLDIKIECWAPEKAEKIFLDIFANLQKNLST